MALDAAEQRVWEAAMTDFYAPDDREPRIPLSGPLTAPIDLFYAIQDAAMQRKMTQGEVNQGMELFDRVMASDRPEAEIAELTIVEDFDGTSIRLPKVEPKSDG